MSSPGAGLSRAALKKRKRQQKINTKLTGLQLPSITSDGLSDDDGDMQSGDDQHSASDSDAVIAAPRVVVASSSSKPQSAHKKSRKESWKFFNRESISHPLLASLSAFTIPKILALKNVKEATSAEKAAMLLSKLVYPMSRDQFYEEVFEKTPYCFKHDLEEDATIANAESKLGVYYGKLVTKKTLKTLLSEHVLPLGSAIRLITADNEYIPETEEVNDSDAEDDDSVDQTNKTTFLTGDEMWKKFMTQKHALEFLQPHVHLDVMWKLCSALEYEFGSRVDGKITLQPSNHNLTIPILAESDKFVLQLEGKTVWTISKPVAEDEEDIVDKKKGTFKPVTYELAPGQSLYVPKGYLTTVEGDQTQHSLFLTLLANHDHAPADLFKTVLPQAVENLVMESTIFKRSLPPDLGRVLGVACSENDEDPRRVAFKEDMNKLLQLVVNQAMDILDPAADQVRLFLNSCQLFSNVSNQLCL